MSKKSIIRLGLFLLSLILGGGVFGYFVYREGVDNIWQSLSAFGLWPFIGFVSISLLNFVLYSWRWQIIINQHLPREERMPLHRVYLHRMGGYAMSYLTPAAQVGGEPVRIALLASDKVKLKPATSSVLLDVAFEISAYIIFIIAGVFLAILEGVGDGGSFLIIALGLVVILVVLFAFFTMLASGRGFFVHFFRLTRLNRIKALNQFEKSIIQTEDMMTNFLSRKKSLIFLVSGVSIAMISFRVVEVFYIAHFFEVSLNFAQAFLVSTLPGIALLLPVPAGLGVFEGSFSAIFTLLAIPLNAVAFALIIRSRDLIFIFVGLMHILSRGRKFVEQKIVKQVTA